MVFLGGPSWKVPLGRRDSTTVSRATANANLPSSLMDFPALIKNFKDQGLDEHDVVVLFGAHTLGFAQCDAFRDHIYKDTNIDPAFAGYLRTICPRIMKSRFLDSGGGGGKKKKSNANATSSFGLDSNFLSLSVVAGSVSSQDEGLNEGLLLEQLVKLLMLLWFLGADSSNDTKVGNADPNTCTILINITVSPTIDLNNYGSILSGLTSYAKVTGEPSRKSVNFLTLITSAGNRVDVVVLLESIRAISERFINTAYGFFLGKRMAYPIVPNYVKLCRAMIELRVDVELKDTIVVAMPKLVEHRNPSQDPRVVSVGPKVGFKPVKQVYRLVFKKNNVNTSGNKKKDAESRKEVSNPNSFDVLNSVENDVDLGSNEGGEDEVEPVDNEMTSFLASERVGFGTNSLLEQWRETYENVDYDYDPYDDDMYECQEIPNNIQSICDNLDISSYE
ncbi:reverse transcriptase domain-containing protein, partial [Tanacetum coccineum]